MIRHDDFVYTMQRPNASVIGLDGIFDRLSSKKRNWPDKYHRLTNLWRRLADQILAKSLWFIFLINSCQAGRLFLTDFKSAQVLFGVNGNLILGIGRTPGDAAGSITAKHSIMPGSGGAIYLRCPRSIVTPTRPTSCRIPNLVTDTLVHGAEKSCMIRCAMCSASASSSRKCCSAMAWRKC